MYRIAINILNWNHHQATLTCVAALAKTIQSTESESICINVLDNGSSPDDWQALSQGLKGSNVFLQRSEKNLGFAGGHNLLLKKAIHEGLHFAWVLNNDAIPEVGCLEKMLHLMAQDDRCAAISPVIRALHSPSHIDFCGARHDWKTLQSINASNLEDGRLLEKNYETSTWLSGAAILIRLSALQQIGLFDERYFAYYEDNDLGARIVAQGFTNRVAFDATVYHETTSNGSGERPAYFHYLMARNALLFWLKNTPNAWHRAIRYHIVQQSIVAADRLKKSGYPDKADACLLGAWDGLLKRTGSPKLNRRPPLLMSLINYLFLIS